MNVWCACQPETYTDPTRFEMHTKVITGSDDPAQDKEKLVSGTNASPPPWVYPKSLITEEVKCISQREMGIENLVIITGIPWFSLMLTHLHDAWEIFINKIMTSAQ